MRERAAAGGRQQRSVHGGWRRQDFGQFKIDYAKTAEFVAIGDVASLRIEVAHAVVAFQFCEDAIGLVLGDLVGGLAAIGGYKVEFLGVFFQ